MSPIFGMNKGASKERVLGVLRFVRVRRRWMRGSKLHAKSGLSRRMIEK